MPPKSDVFRHITDKTVSAITTSTPTQQEVNTGFPKGDEGILELNVGWNGTFNTSGASGAAVADGALKLLRSLRFHTDTHGDIIKNVDGVGMSRMLQMQAGTRGVVVDCASSADGTTFSANLRIPFANRRRLRRPYDSILDMKKAIADMKLQFGVVTDVQSGGTAATINGLRYDVSCQVLEELHGGGNGVLGELPEGMPIWEKMAPVQATAGSMTIPVPTGDRLVARIHLQQATIDPTTGLLTEVSSIINSTAKLTFKIGSDLIFDGSTYIELNRRNKDESQVETMPAGWAFMAWDHDKSIQKMLNLYDYQAGVASNIFIDSVNTVSNGWVIPYMEYYQKLPDGANRKVA